MLRDLEKIIDEADSSGGNGEELERELRSAAQHLWRSQFLYESDWGAKTASLIPWDLWFKALNDHGVNPKTGFRGALVKWPLRGLEVRLTNDMWHGQPKGHPRLRTREIDQKVTWRRYISYCYTMTQST